jgi:hypothetical protein
MLLDLVKRFSPTPLVAILTLNGMIVRVATNYHLVLDRLRVASTASGENRSEPPTVDWRIVMESDGDESDGEFTLHGFTHDGLSFIRISHRSFLAGDRQARCGISFVARDVIREERLFGQYFFPALMSILNEMKENG